MNDGIVIPLNSQAIKAAVARNSFKVLGLCSFMRARVSPPSPCMVWGEYGLRGKG